VTELTLASIADESVRTLTLDTAVDARTRTSVTARITCTQVDTCQIYSNNPFVSGRTPPVQRNTNIDTQPKPEGLQAVRRHFSKLPVHLVEFRRFLCILSIFVKQKTPNET
jgi:hypothetical protein